MDTPLVVLIALFVGAIAVAFYMDWLGLWVSKEELAKEIARRKESTEGREQQYAIGVREKAAAIAVEVGTQDSRVA